MPGFVVVPWSIRVRPKQRARKSRQSTHRQVPLLKRRSGSPGQFRPVSPTPAAIAHTPTLYGPSIGPVRDSHRDCRPTTNRSWDHTDGACQLHLFLVDGRHIQIMRVTASGTDDSGPVSRHGSESVLCRNVTSECPRIALFFSQYLTLDSTTVCAEYLAGYITNCSSAHGSIQRCRKARSGIVARMLWHCPASSSRFAPHAQSCRRRLQSYMSKDV